MRAPSSDAEMEAAMELRHEVFCVEQGVTVEADRDGMDPQAEHLVAEQDGRVVGTCRLLIDGHVARLGRMVVSRSVRGRGVGGLILAEADRVAAAHGATRILLHAQVAARGVYDRAGYLPTSDVFVEEGIEHVSMEKHLA
ncbi:MAG TPA: GNAT family N-acetyltransferase [Thermoleophilaceae bacterium]|nr:GNAT family N-acetyltransferase [Thermoleophilaceae bacterium]